MMFQYQSPRPGAELRSEPKLRCKARKSYLEYARIRNAYYAYKDVYYGATKRARERFDEFLAAERRDQSKVKIQKLTKRKQLWAEGPKGK